MEGSIWYIVYDGYVTGMSLPESLSGKVEQLSVKRHACDKLISISKIVLVLCIPKLSMCPRMLVERVVACADSESVLPNDILILEGVKLEERQELFSLHGG